MNNIKNDILSQIKKGEIKAESKWRFLVHDYFFWALSGVFVALGSLAVSSILHRVYSDQIQPLRQHMGIDSVPVFIQTLPFLWILVFLLLLLASWFNYKKISNSYRKHNGTIVVAAVALAMFLGGLLFILGVGSQIDERVRKHIPAFQQERERRQEIRDNFIREKPIGPRAERFLQKGGPTQEEL